MFSILFYFTSCTNQKAGISHQDTVDVLQLAFSNRELVTSISPQFDTLYVIKNDKIKPNFPGKANSLYLKYVPDTGTIRSKNQPWLAPKSKNHFPRHEITRLEFAGDSALVDIYYFNLVTDYHFKFKKVGERWELDQFYFVME